MTKTMLRITEKVGDGVYQVEFSNGAKKCQFSIDIRNRFGDEIAEEVSKFYEEEGKAKWERGYNLIFATDDELNELERKTKAGTEKKVTRGKKLTPEEERLWYKVAIQGAK
jgi:hypothetical protein